MDTVTTAPQNVKNVGKAAPPSRGPQAKHWAGCTLPNPTADDYSAFPKMQPLVDYYVYGIETGAGGLPHLQFMVCFKKPHRLSAVKKLFPTQAHWEVKSAKSTMQDASNYCKKGDQTHEEWVEWKEAGPNFGSNAQFHEFGTLPLDQKTAGLKVIQDLYQDTVEKAKIGDIENINAEHKLRYYSAIKKIQHDEKKMPENLDWSEGNMPNYWIHGPTGTGKSYKARKMLGNNFYPKNAANKWWDKYNGEENVLIEDMDKSHSYQGYYLKIWSDKYAFSVEVKNSGDYIRPKVIIVTSNYRIQEVFPDPAIHLPLLRRFNVIEMNTPWQAALKAPKSFSTKSISLKSNKKRKYDQPLKKPALYKQNANGQIVINNDKQLLVDEMIVIPDDDNLVNNVVNEVETCDECHKSIVFCECYDPSDHEEYYNAYNEYDDDTEKSFDDLSEDLRNI